MKAMKRTLGILAAAFALLLFPAAAAQAEPFSMSIDNAILDLGGLSGVRAIDSELEPPDPPATLSGDLTGGAVDVPKEGFVFPTKTAEVSTGINADIDMEANEDITGTFDAGTGQLVLDANLKATVAVLGSTCVISPIVLQLSSASSMPYLGEAFVDGIDGVGVISADWSGLPPVTGGGACGIVSGLIAGPGGIAMSHGVYDFQTCETDPGNPLCDPEGSAPTDAPSILTGPPSSTEADVASFTFEKGPEETQEVTGFECSLDGGAFEPCDSGSKTYTGLSEGAHEFKVRSTNSVGEGPDVPYSWTVKKSPTPPPPGPPRFGPLKLKPKVKMVKRGRAVVVTARIRNVGESAAKGVKVCVKAPKRLVRVRKCVKRGNLVAGATATMKFKVKVNRKAKRKAKAKLKFRATGKGLKAKAGRVVIRVR